MPRNPTRRGALSALAGATVAAAAPAAATTDPDAEFMRAWGNYTRANAAWEAANTTWDQAFGRMVEARPARPVFAVLVDAEYEAAAAVSDAPNRAAVDELERIADGLSDTRAEAVAVMIDTPARTLKGILNKMLFANEGQPFANRCGEDNEALASVIDDLRDLIGEEAGAA